MSALSSIITGLFPPSSRAAGVRFSAAARSTSRPTAAPPVKNILSHLSPSSAEFSARPPVTAAASSGGKISPSSRAISSLEAGEYALGFTTAVFPAAIAAASGSSVSSTG